MTGTLIEWFGIGIVAVSIVGMIVAYAVGFNRGRAVGWLDHYFDEVRRERARRDPHGRFIAVKGPNVPQHPQTLRR